MHDTIDERLAAAAAHQLGEGVVLLQAYTAMVRDAGAGPPDAVRGLEEVSRRLRCLDDALLDLARLSRHPPDPAAIDPTEALSVARRLLTECDGAAILVQVLPDPLPGVHADSAHIERLFLHGLRHVARSARRLIVTASPRDRLVHFRVGDERAATDVGPPVRVMHGDRATSDVGVEVCRRIADAHGGELWLDPEGRGLAFTLPAARS